MRALIIAVSFLILIVIFIAVHSLLMFNLANSVGEACDAAVAFAENEKWDEVMTELEKIQQFWEKRRIWAALTISTEEIEQIEISLSQSKVFAAHRQKTDFLGEFAMFTLLMDHIPHQEGFRLAEIL